MDDTDNPSIRSAAASIGIAPKDATASTRKPRPCRLQTSATSAMGFSTPVLVSQWTIMTWVTARSRRSASSTCAPVGGSKAAVRTTACARPSACAISIRRSP